MRGSFRPAMNHDEHLVRQRIKSLIEHGGYAARAHPPVETARQRVVRRAMIVVALLAITEIPQPIQWSWAEVIPALTGHHRLPDDQKAHG